MNLLSETQLATFKKELLKTKANLLKTASNTDPKDSQGDNVGELSMYDNHPADMGTELYERSKDIALNIHAQSELEKVEAALIAIGEKTYGICEKCGEEIPLERLQAIPYTSFCVEHSPEQKIPHDRPVEEEVIIPPNTNTFANRGTEKIIDDQDSFQEIAKVGTSETPSDFVGDYDSLDELYENNNTNKYVEEIEGIVAAGIDGKEIEDERYD